MVNTMASLIFILVVVGAVLVIASGLWVAAALVAVISNQDRKR
jgi:hypothetical protein